MPMGSPGSFSLSAPQIAVYIAAVWPAFLIIPSYLPWFRRGRIRESRWFLAFTAYFIFLVTAVILDVFVLRTGSYNWTRTSYGTLGVKVGPDLPAMTIWLVLGAFCTIPVALRSLFKKGHWLQPPRWRKWYW
jgi:hypothetical protein